MRERTNFSGKVKAEAALRANGRCESCTRKLLTGDYHFDHIIPSAMGGPATLDNCSCICRSCHSIKTCKADVPQIAKAKRRERKRLGIKPRQSRPLPGTKASGVRKRMNGNVERW